MDRELEGEVDRYHNAHEPSSRSLSVSHPTTADDRAKERVCVWWPCPLLCSRYKGSSVHMLATNRKVVVGSLIFSQPNEKTPLQRVHEPDTTRWSVSQRVCGWQSGSWLLDGYFFRWPLLVELWPLLVELRALLVELWPWWSCGHCCWRTPRHAMGVGKVRARGLVGVQWGQTLHERSATLVTVEYLSQCAPHTNNE